MWQPSRRNSGKPKSSSTHVRDAFPEPGSMEEDLFCTTGNRSISHVNNVSEFAQADASGSKTPARTTPHNMLDSSPSDVNVSRLVNPQHIYSKVDALIGDAWQSPPAARSQAPATQAGQSRKSKHENDSPPSNADNALSLYRSHLDADCLRKQLQAVILERDHLHDSLNAMQQRSMHEVQARDNLTAEFRTEFRKGLASMQQQLSDMSPVIVNEIRRALQSDLYRLKTGIAKAAFVDFCGVFDAMEQRLAKEISHVKDLVGNSNVVVQQLDCLNANMNKYAEVINESLGTRNEPDFSVVLKAIEDLEARVDLTRVQNMLQAHKVDTDRHFSYTEQLMRNCMAVCSDPESKGNSSLDLSIISRELKATQSDSKSELEGSLLQAIRQNKADFATSLQLLKESMRGLQESVRDLGQLHESKHVETSRNNEEVSRSLKQVNDTLKQRYDVIQKPHYDPNEMISRLFEESQKQLSNVQREIADLQNRTRQRDAITATRHEESNQKLSFLQDTLQQLNGFDLEKLQQSVRVECKALQKMLDMIQTQQNELLDVTNNNLPQTLGAVHAKQDELLGVVKQHGDQHHAALSKIDQSVRERQKEPIGNEEMNGLLKQMHTTVTQLGLESKEKKNTTKVPVDLLDLSPADDSNSLNKSAFRVFEESQNQLKSDFKNLRDSLLNECRMLQRNADDANSRWSQTLVTIQAKQNELLGVVKQQSGQHSVHEEMNGMLKHFPRTAAHLGLEYKEDNNTRKVAVDLFDPGLVDDSDQRRPSTSSVEML